MIFLVVQGLVILAAIVGFCYKVAIPPREAWFIIGAYALAAFLQIISEG